jgi:D-alanyl-D-alanine carboxypeptidase
VRVRAGDVGFPGGSFAPSRVTVAVRGAAAVALPGPHGRRVHRLAVRARAAAELAPPAELAVAEGGGYHGPLAYRQGKPMRPDVALAFDRLAAAARREAGIALIVVSGYRSDAEQAKLFAAQPAPQLFRVLGALAWAWRIPAVTVPARARATSAKPRGRTWPGRLGMRGEGGARRRGGGHAHRLGLDTVA